MTTDTIILYKGTHSDGECAAGKRCLAEWYNWLTRGVNTDSCPPGVSGVLHTFGMQLNDALPGARRQKLRFALPNGDDPLAGTAGDGLDETRGYMALDWLIRTYTPAWLGLAGLNGDATALRDLRRVTDLVTLAAAEPVLRQAAAAGAAAWNAARAAAGAAAGDAVWNAAWAAAAAAAGDAVWNAAWAAAGGAAGDAVWNAAWAAAGAAAGAAAWDAAWNAARAAGGAAARAAAGDAAKKKLAPTVTQLQDSAITLYQAMMRPEATP